MGLRQRKREEREEREEGEEREEREQREERGGGKREKREEVGCSVVLGCCCVVLGCSVVRRRRRRRRRSGCGRKLPCFGKPEPTDNWFECDLCWLAADLLADWCWLLTGWLLLAGCSSFQSPGC